MLGGIYASFKSIPTRVQNLQPGELDNLLWYDSMKLVVGQVRNLPESEVGYGR